MFLAFSRMNSFFSSYYIDVRGVLRGGIDLRKDEMRCSNAVGSRTRRWLRSTYDPLNPEGGICLLCEGAGKSLLLLSQLSCPVSGLRCWALGGGWWCESNLDLRLRRELSLS